MEAVEEEGKEGKGILGWRRARITIPICAQTRASDRQKKQAFSAQS
jgi:hypothetical protein